MYSVTIAFTILLMYGDSAYSERPSDHIQMKIHIKKTVNKQILLPTTC